MKSYLSGLRHLSISSGMGDPHMHTWPRLEYVLKGAKRSQSVANPKPRLPISPDILRKLRGVWLSQTAHKDGLMRWAACLFGFFGFLRAGEFTVPSEQGYDPTCHLSKADISIDSYVDPTFMSVLIKKSKTDPFRQGVKLFIGHNRSDLCPVEAMLRYLVIRGHEDGPLFIMDSGSPLTRQKLVVSLRSALSTANIDASAYCGHSFRIGAATTAASQGVEDAMIKTLGRWESTAYQRYIKIPRQSLSNIYSILCQTRAIPSTSSQAQ